MPFKTFAISILVALTVQATAAASVELAFFEGELTKDSPLAFDPWGNFHYQAIQFHVSESALYQFTMTSNDFVPYWMLFHDGFNPSNTEDPPPIGSGSAGTLFVWLSADNIYDLMFTTFNYNPTPLGSFTFLVEGPEGAVFTILPAPGALAVFAIAGLGLIGGRKRNRS